MFTSTFTISVTLAVAFSYLSVAVTAIPLASRSMDASVDTKITASLCRIAGIVYDDPVASVANFDHGNLTYPDDDILPALFRQLLQSCCDAQLPGNIIDNANAVDSKAASIPLPDMDRLLSSASTPSPLTTVSKMLMATPSSSPHSFSVSQGISDTIGALATMPTLVSGSNNRLPHDAVGKLILADAASSINVDESSVPTASPRLRPIGSQFSKGNIIAALDSTNDKEENDTAHVTISRGLSQPSPSPFASPLFSASNGLLFDAVDKGSENKPEHSMKPAKTPGSGLDSFSSQMSSSSANSDTLSMSATSKSGFSPASSPTSSFLSRSRTATSASAILSALALPSVPAMAFENPGKPSMTASIVPFSHPTRVGYKNPASTSETSQSTLEPCGCEDDDEIHISAHEF